MEILEIRVLGGPNFWSINHKVIAVTLDIGRFETLPSNMIEGFTVRLVNLLPGLASHGCSKRAPGGFIERLRSGTWMGHITEHIAIEIQIMAGMECNFGKTTGAGKYGVYNVAFEYVEERAGIYAAHAAVRIAEAVAAGKDYDPEHDFSELRKIFLRDRPGPSTESIIRAAEKRNIPHLRLNHGSLVQLGFGKSQKRISATLTENTSIIAVDLASDKHATKEMLKQAGIPVPAGRVITELSQLEPAMSELGFPLTIKPQDGNQGKGVALEIRTLEHAISAFQKARHISRNIVVETFYEGHDYRLLVVNYHLVAAALRTPAMVTGDGRSSIRELIEISNSDPLRGEEHENILTRIKTDTATEEHLHNQNMSLDHIPANGENVYLRKTANLSTGGTAVDVTSLVHPDIAEVACRAARTIGLDVCGIDFISADISRSLKECPGVVIEVNAAPGFRMHTHPASGNPQPVGEAVVDMLFPGDNKGRIPIVAITGTNGKTTTTRLVAHMAKIAGYTVGFTTTEGIYINGTLIEEGDCTGPVSARKVLLDRSVDFAVLECARGGMLRSGLAFDHCDTGIVTNVAEDHIGLKGVNSLEDMAKVKAIVPESVHPDGYAVLNEKDANVYRMKDRVKCNVAFFSLNGDSPRIRQHCLHGGIAAVFSDGHLIIQRGNDVMLKMDVKDIPIAFGGKASFMIENILAAMLAAFTRNIGAEAIRQALLTFEPGYEHNPGRMNIFKLSNCTFLLDYAHNFHGISALGEFIRQSEATEKTGIISVAGDRRDIDIYNVGGASAELFDRIIIRVDEDTRGRKDSEIIELIYSGIIDKNQNLPVSVIKDETEAVRYALNNARPGSLVVLFAEKISRVYDVLGEFIKAEQPVNAFIQK